MQKKVIIGVLILASLAVNAFFASIFLYQKSMSKTSETDKFPLLSKRIFAENQNDIIINFIPLRVAMKDYISKQTAGIGIYFEYLPSGISIGVNDRDEVRLASLSKVPLAMSIYRAIEKEEFTKNEELTIKKEHLDKGFGTLWQKGEGAKLPVSDLINLLLTESDNTAYNVLFDELTTSEINDVYENLDIILGEDKQGPIVSPKSYSSIFRSLYLSSYLARESSNEILKIMTKSDFNDKIVAGIPADVQISHKIGVFETLDDGNVYIDCGIVYVPQRPYIICAFVKGSNEDANTHISHLSEMIYKYIVKVKGG